MNTKKSTKKAESETPKEITAVNVALGNAVVSVAQAVAAASKVSDLPEAISKRILKIRDGLTKSTVHIKKQLNGLGAKAERAAAKEARVATAATKKVEKLAKLVAQQKKLTERIAKLQE